MMHQFLPSPLAGEGSGVRGLCGCVAILVAALLTPPLARAQSDDSAPVVRREAIQQQVRTMARQVVAGILDLQIQQLRENGLEALPIYADIQEMRKHLDLLIDTQMSAVVDLLVRVETAAADQREPLLQAARQKSRQIVVALLVERQNLLRRLKIAEMAAQVLQLIKMQSAVLAQTEALPGQPPARREPLTLAAIEDQRDVGAVYGRLKETLAEVSHWAGAFGSQAAEGLRLLEAGHVDQQLGTAESQLRSSRFADSATAQQAVIRGLEALLEQIQKLQGVEENKDHNAVAEAIQRLIEQQQKLREETQQTNLAQPEADKLINRQTELAKAIAQMRDSPQATLETKQPLAAAAKEAQEATARLFDQKRDEALARQDNVVQQLQKAMEQAKQQAAQPAAAAMDPEQAAALAHDLEKARAELQQAAQHQQQASQAAPQNPHQARHAEHEVARQLAAVPQGKQLPQQVVKSVEEARQAADAAEKKLESHPAPGRREATRQAEQAIQRAIAQTESALADARRNALSAKAQQLAQAAAAAEKAPKPNAAQAAELRRQQAQTQQELARLLQEQLKTLSAARQAVEQKLAQRLESVGQKLQRLAQAKEHVAQAAAQQKQAAVKPPAKPDAAQAAAQRQVTQHAAAAQQLAQADAPEAAQTLDKAGQHSTAAAQHMAKGDAKAAAPAQEKAAQHLDQADKQLDAAAAALAQKAAGEFHAESHSAAQLADKAVPADPNATAALHQAENLAAQSAQQPAAPPAQAMAADQAIQQAFEQAAASLASRQVQIQQAAQAAQQQTAQPNQPAAQTAQQKAEQDAAKPPTPSPSAPNTTGGRAMATSQTGAATAAPESRPLDNTPWFAKLPPEVRNAIRANAQRTPPRGYEDRLQRYFQSAE